MGLSLGQIAEVEVGVTIRATIRVTFKVPVKLEVDGTVGMLVCMPKYARYVGTHAKMCKEDTCIHGYGASRLGMTPDSTR